MTLTSGISETFFDLRDARIYQTFALFSLLVIGMSRFDFDISIADVAVIVSAALATQYVFGRWFLYPEFDPRSALITAFSLCLLLRTESYWMAALAAALAIGSKFIFRVNGKHIFNPANIAIATMLAFDAAWISPAQWGSNLWFGFLFVSLGGMVVTRARRADVTITFLICYIGLIFARAVWLGDPLEIPIKQISSGAILLFAFFMISDPRTIPDARWGRILFALMVAVFAFVLQFVFYQPKGLMYALAVLAPLSVVIDRWLPSKRYQWTQNLNEGVT